MLEKFICELTFIQKVKIQAVHMNSNQRTDQRLARN